MDPISIFLMLVITFVAVLLCYTVAKGAEAYARKDKPWPKALDEDEDDGSLDEGL